MHTTYKHDPDHAELLQSMHTLMDNNYHGIPGAGDCDCFVIAATACFIASRNRCEIVLVGNKPDQFTHVYNTVYYSGAMVPFDLTQPTFATERPYKYKKIFEIQK
jgi:hypothetical protein